MSVFPLGGHKPIETDMDDFELLQEYLKHGREDAFSEFVARYIDLVYSVALRKVSRPDAAQEITQAVFTILARKAPTIRPGAILPAWLHETTRLTASHWIRSEMRRVRREQEAYMQSPSNDPKDTRWEVIAPLLDDAIASLGEKDRHALMLRYFQDRNTAEIARSLASSEEAVQKRLERSLDKLRGYFSKRGVSITSIAIGTALCVHSTQAAPLGLAASVATATLKGSTLAAPTLSIIKETLNLMAWTKIKTGIAGGAALILVFGTGHITATHYEYKTATAIQTVTQASPTNQPSAGLTSTAPKTSFRWDGIESTDYRQYIANLRAAGIPEQAVRDIVTADVARTYAQRIHSVFKPQPQRPYWQKQPRNDQPSTTQIKQIYKVMDEETAVLESLFGDKFSPQQLLDQMFLQPDDLAVSVSWLSPEKQKAALAALDSARQLDQESEAISQDNSASAKIFASRLEVLKGILSPEELTEYKLRESPLAETIRNNDGKYSNLTADEFKAFVEVRESLGSKLSRTPESLDEQARLLAQKIGEQRAQEIIQKSGTEYDWIRQATESCELPVETADKALQIKIETEKAEAQILNDPQLTAEQQTALFQAIQLKARTDFNNCLGTNAAKIAYNGGAAWLFFDARAYRNQITPRP